MKRFHVHVAVKDLASSIRFYSSIFAQSPTVTKSDYAKWMLDEPRVNFAISTRSAKLGVNHLGFQVDSDTELAAMRDQLAAADQGLVEEQGVACCYGRSDKYWVTDPTGLAWETFHSLGSVPVFGTPHESAKQGATCGGVPAAAPQPARASACCAPAPAPQDASAGCCS